MHWAMHGREPRIGPACAMQKVRREVPMAAQATGSTSNQVQADRWSVPAGSSSVAPGNQATAADPAPKPRSGLAFRQGSGSSSAPATSAPKAPKQKTTTGHREEVNTALDKARSAAAAYEKAANEFREAQKKADDPNRKITASELREVERLKAAS